jgi:hypothetical protein
VGGARRRRAERGLTLAEHMHAAIESMRGEGRMPANTLSSSAFRMKWAEKQVARTPALHARDAEHWTRNCETETVNPQKKSASRFLGTPKPSSADPRRRLCAGKSRIRLSCRVRLSVQCKVRLGCVQFRVRLSCVQCRVRLSCVQFRMRLSYVKRRILLSCWVR